MITALCVPTAVVVMVDKFAASRYIAGSNRQGAQEGSLEPPGPLLGPPGPLLTHLHTVYMAYSERLPARLNPLAERACVSLPGTSCCARCSSWPSGSRRPVRRLGSSGLRSQDDCDAQVLLSNVDNICPIGEYFLTTSLTLSNLVRGKGQISSKNIIQFRQ
jgi:hypothetical protein